jgi:demethylsterigmatocystin 6-O-methyltransferase
MAEDSLILIDDIVLPDVGVPPFATALDITMMCYLGARERTMEHWTNLMEKAGLKINEIYTYRESQGDSVLEVVPK